MDDGSGRGPSRHANGGFGSGNPGRRLGSRNRMSGRIVLGMLRHGEELEEEILERLGTHHINEYMRLIGRMLPKPAAEEGPDLEAPPPGDSARVAGAVRVAPGRMEAGGGSLADIQDALARLGPEGWETTLNRVEIG